MAAKTPKKFRQARKAAKVDAKKAFSGKRQAGLKDKNPLMKFSADDKKALSEVSQEAKGGYITDEKGNKIKTTNMTPKEAAAEYKRVTAARNEAFRSAMRAEFGEYAGKKATQADYDSNPKFKNKTPKTAPEKPAPKITEAGKVRSAVTAPEPKPQGYKIDPKTGRKIQAPKIINKSTPTKGGRVVRIQEPRVRATKPPVVKKGFAVGKQLNAEGKAIYDRLIKEGVKPKSALNKALFRQEKAATAAAKAAGPVASAAKSAAAAVKAQGPVKSKIPAGAKPIGIGTMKDGKLTFKFDDKQIKSIVEKNKAAKAIKVPSTVVSSKPNVPGKELVLRPKPGAVATKAAASTSAKKKLTAKTAALGAAKFAGKAVTGKVGMAVTAASLLAGPIQRKLSEGTKGRTTYDNLNAIAERSKKEGTVYTRSGDKPMNNASYGRAVPGAGGATIASVPKANAAPRKETQKLRGPVKRTSATGPTMNYKVETGDTLSAIAKRSGITLSELMALNKKIKDPRKIYRNTNIKIPSAGKVPDPMYTGPVPYRPGSKEAKAYEALRASRKK
jgi:LysM repeat protein